MVDIERVKQINSIIEDYFIKNTKILIVPVKDLMADFIAAGIFAKDIKKGLPIRKVLRELDDVNKLDLMPFVYAERKDNKIYWYFIPLNTPRPTASYKSESKKIQSEDDILSRSKKDEDYVIDLCNIVLNKKGHRQKTFGFLLGDVHKDEKTQTRLPLDAFYEDLKLAIKYKKFYSAKPILDDDESEPLTVSGMSREEQRERYDLRRAELLRENGIRLVNVLYSNFVCDERNKIVRDNVKNIKIVQDILKKYIIAE